MKKDWIVVPLFYCWCLVAIPTCTRAFLLTTSLSSSTTTTAAVHDGLCGDDVRVRSVVVKTTTTTAQLLAKNGDVDDDNSDYSTPCSSSSSRKRRRQVIINSLLVVGLSSLFPSSTVAVQAKDLKEEYRQGTAALSDMNDAAAPVPREAYRKLDNGIIYADLRTGGSGSEQNVVTAGEGSRVNMQWVLRKSNGYFVDSSASHDSGTPFIFTVGDGTAIQGVDVGIRGMKVGGVRRLLVPPSLAYVEGLDDGKPGPLPQGFGPKQQMRRVQTVRKDVPGEYVYLEVQLTRIR